jgi:hypothetical protein
VTVLSEQQIRTIFYEYLPDTTGIMTIPAEKFVEQARNHPYVQLQMQMGVYTDENLAQDFLSPARAHPELGLQVICMEIFDQILDGIPDETAANYVRHVAAHEAHHFHANHGPVSAADHALNELGCVQEIVAKHPELNEAVACVEANSPVYRRVYARLDDIKNDIQKNGRIPR